MHCHAHKDESTTKTGLSTRCDHRQRCHHHHPAPPNVKRANLSRRLCEEESNYVDKDTGQCKECPPVVRPVLVFLTYACATGLLLFLLYVLLYRSWRVVKLSARAVRWVATAHAHSFGQQGPSKFRVTRGPPRSILHAPWMSACQSINDHPPLATPSPVGGSGLLPSAALSWPDI